MNLIKRMFQSEGWKLAFAWVCVWGYLYNAVIWPLVFWITTLLTTFTRWQWPAPPLVPWEQLAVMTANLAVIGGIQMLRDKNRLPDDPP